MLPTTAPLAQTTPLTKLNASFQSGVRFRARPSDALKQFFAQAIGSQRVVYNAKVMAIGEPRIRLMEAGQGRAKPERSDALTRWNQAYARGVVDGSAVLGHQPCQAAASIMPGEHLMVGKPLTSNDLGYSSSVAFRIVGEDRLFAQQRRMEIASGVPEEEIKTPLDQTYSQFKDTELTPWLSEMPSQILRNGAVRWMNAKQRQLKGLAKAPTIRNKHNFNSVLITKELFRFTDITDPVTGEIKQHLVIGTVADVIDILEFDAHIPFGAPNQITIRRTSSKWWLSFSYTHDAPEDYVPRTAEELAYELNRLSEPELRLATLGIDRNVKDNCVATSDGRFFDFSDAQKERIARKEKGKIRHQKKFARQEKGSANSRKTLRRMGAKQDYITHVRGDFSHQTSHSIVTTPANDDRAPLLLGIEDLKVKNMVKKPKAKQDPVTGKWLKNGRKAKSALTKKILGSCWGSIKTQVQYKAERRNALVVAVPPHYTSQMCSRCGHTSPDNRHEERFICQRCHLYAHSDTNAGINIRALAIAKVRNNEVKNKVKKSVAFKRKISGREPSGVPVESGKTQDKAAQQ